MRYSKLSLLIRARFCLAAPVRPSSRLQDNGPRIGACVEGGGQRGSSVYDYRDQHHSNIIAALRPASDQLWRNC